MHGCMTERVLPVHKCVQAVVTSKNAFACDIVRCQEALVFFSAFHTSNLLQQANFAVAFLGFWKSRFESRPGDGYSV